MGVVRFSFDWGTLIAGALALVGVLATIHAQSRSSHKRQNADRRAAEAVAEASMTKDVLDAWRQVNREQAQRIDLLQQHNDRCETALGELRGQIGRLEYALHRAGIDIPTRDRRKP